MPNAFIMNAHHRYSFSPGALNAELAARFEKGLTAKGYAIQHTRTDDSWDVQTEVDKHRWADVIIVQSPVNWMGVPWPMKKYGESVPVWKAVMSR